MSTLVKICGITNVEDALAAVAAGADMLGLVFAESPRRIDGARAREIVDCAAGRVEVVGVFMDQPRDEIAHAAVDVRLDRVQLHGSETPDDCHELVVMNNNVGAAPGEHRPPAGASGSHRRDADAPQRKQRGCCVIKRIRVDAGDTNESIRERMRPFEVGAFLLDPGAGSGRAFDWRIAADLGPNVFVSGGLTPENVGEAVRIARPAGVDVSSGVEVAPGRKDHDRMRAFVESVRSCAM